MDSIDRINSIVDQLGQSSDPSIVDQLRIDSIDRMIPKLTGDGIIPKLSGERDFCDGDRLSAEKISNRGKPPGRKFPQ